MQKMVEGEAASRPAFHTLETVVRAQVHGFIQQLPEDGVAEWLGRTMSVRRASIDAPPGSRNGRGKPRQLALLSGRITVRRPRVPNAEERFVRRLLPLFQCRTKEVGALLPELCRHGLAFGDSEWALRGVLGSAAQRSASSLVRIGADAAGRKMALAVESGQRESTETRGTTIGGS